MLKNELKEVYDMKKNCNNQFNIKININVLLHKLEENNKIQIKQIGELVTKNKKHKIIKFEDKEDNKNYFYEIQTFKNFEYNYDSIKVTKSLKRFLNNHIKKTSLYSISGDELKEMHNNLEKLYLKEVL